MENRIVINGKVYKVVGEAKTIDGSLMQEIEPLTEIDELKDKVDSLENKIGELNSKIDTIIFFNDKLSVRNAQLESKIKELERKVNISPIKRMQ